MFDRLDHDDLTEALDELITCLGVKEELDSQNLAALLRAGDTQGCVRAIAAQLGLPVRINLSYAPGDYRPDSPGRFSTTELAQTDCTGRGIEGITAQVSIPLDLPMYGTSGLQGYPIHVRVSEDARAHPETFVAIMAHELAHVLLASLHSPYADSDLHTDLVPIILGLSGIVRRGRKIVQTTTEGNTTATRTITYGYLTDSQFDFACDYVAGLLHRHSHDKATLLRVVEQLQRKIKTATRALATFRDYFRYLDSHPTTSMRKEHAERVVQLHGEDYTREWENRITAVRRKVEHAEAFAQKLEHYTTRSLEQLDSQVRILELASEQLDQITVEITRDNKILRKYVSLAHKLRRFLWPNSD